MKKSIRALKKKYKAKQLCQKMQILEDLPSFLAIAKWHRDVIKTLDIDITVAYVSGQHLNYYQDPIYFFDDLYSKFAKQFPHPQVYFVADKCRRKWLSELLQRETEDPCCTKDSCHYGW